MSASSRPSLTASISPLRAGCEPEVVRLSPPIARRTDNAASGGHCERMKLRECVAGDWSWLQEWFKNKLRDRKLAPVSAEWLEALLAERTGVR
ncbi:hypothetical protein Brsp04_03345 [Brucella sp. NBRC 12952]